VNLGGCLQSHLLLCCWSSAFSRSWLGVGVAEADFSTLGGGAGLATGALHWCFMGAETANFFKDAFHLELGLETLESAIDGLTFTDGNFWHTIWTRTGCLKKGAETKPSGGRVKIEVLLRKAGAKMTLSSCRVAHSDKKNEIIPALDSLISSPNEVMTRSDELVLGKYHLI
jgi:hypothetical protein